MRTSGFLLLLSAVSVGANSAIFGSGAYIRWLSTTLRGGGDSIDVKCTLRGKTYDVSAEKVADVWAGIESEAGIEPELQTLIFKGKKLTEGDQTLADAGVVAGDLINVVASRKAGGTSKSAGALADLDDESEDEAAEAGTAASGGALAGADAAMAAAMSGMGDAEKEKIEQLMNQMGGKEGMQNMLKQMGLDGPMTPDKIDGILKQIKDMFSNPAISQLFSNPEILEQSRQQILSNPMLMQAYDAMGMGGLIRDPEAFRAQMEGMKKMLENPDLLGKAMAGLADIPMDEFDEGEL